VRAVLDAGHDVVPVPGASALLAALVATGLPTVPFTFFGFVPRSGRERDAFLAQLAMLPHTAVMYESPGRLHRLLADLRTSCGADRRIAVARELTKVHETFVRGTIADVVAYYDERTTVKGEVVVVLDGAPEPPPPSEHDAAAVARALLADGTPASRVARELARRTGLSRNDAYTIALAESTRRDGDAQ
jgi:16S rRNA (cytidine1402-2'-O)-methyltransferase